MKISSMRVDWSQRNHEAPELILCIRELPVDVSSLRYQFRLIDVTKASGIYYGEDLNTGLVNFYYEDPEDSSGFGGQVFKLTLVDGSQVNIKGPWSSRPAAMNKHGFGPCMSVTFECKRSPRQLHTGYMLVSVIQSLLPDMLPDVLLVKATDLNSNDTHDNGEFRFIPSLKEVRSLN